MQRIGLEYELEGLEHEMFDRGPPKGWRLTHDGTLRGIGGEFVSRQPLPIGDAVKHLNTLNKFLDGVYDITHRCSMHMHIDFDKRTGWQILGGYILLVAHENIFFSYAPDRAGNHFCTGLLRSPAFYQGLSTVSRCYTWENNRPVGHPDTLRLGDGFRAVDTKYTSVNAAPMTNINGQASLELRHFAPIMEPDRLQGLCDVVSGVTDMVDQLPTGGWISTKKKLLALTKDNKQLHSDVVWCCAVVDSLIEQPNRKGRPEPRARLFDHEIGVAE